MRALASLTALAAPRQIPATAPATAAKAAVPARAWRKLRRDRDGVGSAVLSPSRVEAADCHAASLPTRSRNSTTAAPAARSGSRSATGAAWERVRTAAAPARPKMPARTAPVNRLRNSSTPASAASPAMTSAMPVSRAALSAVPKREMAQSFTPGGTASITTPPTPVNGDRDGLANPASNSPAATPPATATIPAAAAQRPLVSRTLARGTPGCRTERSGRP